MFNQQNVPNDKSKKPIYLYVIFGIVFFIIVTSVILFYNSEQEPLVVEERPMPEEPKPEPIKIDTSDVESLRKLNSIELVSYGNDFVSDRFYDGSVILYQIALEKDKNNIRALNGLGYSLTQLHHLDDAARQYEKVLELNSFNIDANNGIGEVYVKLEKYDDALSHYQKSLEIDPNNVNAYNGLGLAYTNQGKYSQAIKSFQQSLNLDPFRIETHNGIAFSYFQSGQFNISEQSYRKVLSVDPDNLDALLGLALVLSELGENEEAAKMIDSARNVSNSINSQIINKIILQGNILNETGEYRQAIQLYDKVIKLYDNVNALNGKAIALVNLKQYDEAIIILDKVLDLEPSNTNAQNIKKLIPDDQK